MSINHFSTDIQETLWWQEQQQQHHQAMNMEPTQDSPSSIPHKTSTPTPQQYSSLPSHLYHQHHSHHLHHHHQLWVSSYNSQESPSIYPTQNPPNHTFNLNHKDSTVVLDEQELDDQSTTNQEPPQQGQDDLEKEPMFEKPLTPSDVGKLNRLVIPKQHAEKYFPLGGDSGDKGLLLSFEDESGKCWRFRYSYWNSSQSYVLTKGWSRYVKDKRLDAGDVIVFERDRRDSERLFIGWRRRGAGSGCGGVAGGGWNRSLYSSGHPYPVEVQSHGVTVPYQPADCPHAGAGSATPVGNSKTLRLFGVNLECQLDESEPSTPSYSSIRQTQMDTTLSHDVNQMMRNRQG